MSLFCVLSLSSFLVAPCAGAVQMSVICLSIVMARPLCVRATFSNRTDTHAKRARPSAIMASASTMAANVRPYLDPVSTAYYFHTVFRYNLTHCSVSAMTYSVI